MADGTTKPIEDVRIGDEVLATDPATGETVARMVTAEITGEGLKDLVTLALSVDGEAVRVTATDGHPFWIPELLEHVVGVWGGGVDAGGVGVAGEQDPVGVEGDSSFGCLWGSPRSSVFSVPFPSALFTLRMLCRWKALWSW
ncbi:hypothetical protein [Streptomyces californicus]|uniref:hypothetical protein n=1 Tax=Streptomyces californicus TaxID=67351 RepID=UPI0037F96779